MNLNAEFRQFTLQQQTRRAFLGRMSQRVGALALASLAHPALLRAATGKGAPGTERWTGVVNPPHFPPKVRRVIWLSMAGGPSHLETFDYKPKLAEMHKEPMRESVKGKTDRAVAGPEALVLWPAAQVQEVR